MKYIGRNDIEAGDTIKVTESHDGVLVERTGTVEAVNTLRGTVSTKEGGFLWHQQWEGTPTFQLLDRPKPRLPIITGAVIIANRVTGLGTPHITLALRYDGYWVSLASGKVINATNIVEWTPAKVVEA